MSDPTGGRPINKPEVAARLDALLRRDIEETEARWRREPAPDPLFGQVLPAQMTSKRHSILVRPFLYGQFRIQLTRLDWPDPYAPPGHGSIVRELCTYEPRTVVRVVTMMRVHADPEGYCRTLERPWNCEAPGRGRIRLDNREPFKCPDCGAESWNENDKRNRYCVRCHKFFD